MLPKCKQLKCIEAVAAVEDVLKGVDIAFALGHLATIDFEVVVVYPKLTKLLTCDCLCLRDFVYVMHWYVVDATGVDVDLVGQCLSGDDGAF
jgi:hypothetical protein